MKHRPATEKLGRIMDDATRSRLAILRRDAGGGPVNLYSVFDRRGTACLIVTATCSEDAVATCQDIGDMEDWSIANTTTRRVMRNIDEQPGQVLTVVKLTDARNRLR